MVSLPIVFLIFLSSNYPQENLKQGIVAPTTTQPEKGFVDNGKVPGKGYNSPVNDLTVADFKFPDDHSRGLVVPHKKIIQEKLIPDEKKEKNKTPVPLYSLVKNTCGEGYALDENGVCQKTITVRSGKNFDTDRRKRHALDFEWLTGKAPSNLYPGLVPDKNGGCTKVVRSSERAFVKSLPP